MTRRRAMIRATGLYELKVVIDRLQQRAFLLRAMLAASTSRSAKMRAAMALRQVKIDTVVFTHELNRRMRAFVSPVPLAQMTEFVRSIPGTKFLW